MRQIFDKVKNAAHQTILRSSDTDLRTDDYAQKIERTFRPEPLELVGEKHVEIKDISTAQYINRMTSGGPVSGGGAQMAEMYMDVNGSSEVFEFLAKNSQLPQTQDFFPWSQGNNKKMVYQGVAKTITGIPSVEQKLKTESDEKFDNTRKILKGVNEEIETFVQRELRPLIDQTIEAEKKRRGNKAASEAALK